MLAPQILVYLSRKSLSNIIISVKSIKNKYRCIFIQLILKLETSGRSRCVLTGKWQANHKLINVFPLNVQENYLN